MQNAEHSERNGVGQRRCCGGQEKLDSQKEGSYHVPLGDCNAFVLGLRHHHFQNEFELALQISLQ